MIFSLKRTTDYSMIKLNKNRSDIWKLFGCFVLIVTLIIYLTIDILLENDKEIFAYKEEHSSKLSHLSLFDSGKFFVNTKKCRIPWVDPFGSQSKQIFKPKKYKNCANDKDLVTKYFNETQRRYILNINHSNAERITCCYQEVQRAVGDYPDNLFKLQPCYYFNQNFTVPRYIDAMIVMCKSNGRIKRMKRKPIQKDAFSFIQDQSEFLDINISNDHIRRPNVLMFGINNLSSFNFKRNMPKTANFLKENDWFELEGYNKVNENTFPNLMPLLTGFNLSIANSYCNPNEIGGLDNCYFIWDEFKFHGYVTAYAEDTMLLSTFTFEKMPTDYYLRPLMLAIEYNMNIQFKDHLAFCVGRRHSADYVYDFGIEFAKRHSKKPGFGFFWTNSFSYNEFSASSSMDVKILEYLEKMKDDGIFETSIVMFFSDHGTQSGPLLDLPEGFLEERLPMFFMSLPKWFCDAYPDYVKALKINANRLTTPFDIHRTLKHIMSLRQASKIVIRPAFSCETAQSIFHEISEERTCADACIPEHWCACLFGKNLSTKNPVIRKITDLIIDEINDFLKANNFSLCRPLKRISILEAQIHTDDVGGIFKDTFRIKFKVLPKKAKFQATAEYDHKKQKMKLNLNDISRLDSYESYSKCIHSKLAKKFCVCKNV